MMDSIPVPTKGLFISCDIPMAEFIIHLNEQQPENNKFIISVLDDTGHLFVRPHVKEMIRNAISKFRDQITYGKLR